MALFKFDDAFPGTGIYGKITFLISPGKEDVILMITGHFVLHAQLNSRE